MTDTTITALADTAGAQTVYAQHEGRIDFTRLCGITISDPFNAAKPVRLQGVALINADGRRYEGGDLTLELFNETPGGLTCRWRIGASGLVLATTWQADPATGIISRNDAVENAGPTPVTLTRCLARIAFPQGEYECYTQASRWSVENQGAWQLLRTGISVQHVWGRTTEGATPLLALRARGAVNGLAIHILPLGNWTIRVSPVTDGGELPAIAVEFGLADENLHCIVQPGERFVLPEALLQPLPNAEVHSGAPALHRYLNAHLFAGAKPSAPVVYNTWFDQFDILEVPRLRAQLAAARDAGCEVFVIDAGWYGAGGPNWSAQTGDWREKTEAAFHGQMRAFADEVRAAGLGFGLWMEPERFGPQAPIRAAHPEWFIPSGSSARIDLTQPAAYAYQRSEIARLVETYDLAWMKVDFNFVLDPDASGAELHDYYAAWYRLLDDIRLAYPRTFFEGCSSGAMRGDLATLTHFDGHFLSDTVNPIDVLRIMQGAWLRLPPGRLGLWAVLRSAGHAAPRYGQSQAESPHVIIAPHGAVWEPSETVDLSFAVLVAMPGMLGFSGDLASLPPDALAELREHVAFFKTWREFITGAAGYLLTTPEPISARTGWVGFQLSNPAHAASLVFAYRLGVAAQSQRWLLHDLNPSMAYGVRRGIGAGANRVLSGEQLMREGLAIDIPPAGGWRGNAAAVYVVEPQG